MANGFAGSSPWASPSWKRRIFLPRSKRRFVSKLRQFEKNGSLTLNLDGRTETILPVPPQPRFLFDRGSAARASRGTLLLAAAAAGAKISPAHRHRSHRVHARDHRGARCCVDRRVTPPDKRRP